MDHIEFQINKLDQEHLPSCVMVTAIINGEPKKDGPFDAPSLIAGLDVPFFEFYPWSCSCGAPGCSGFHSCVRVETHKNHVSWQIPDEEGYLRLRLPQRLTFDRAEYEKKVADLHDTIRKMEDEEGLYAERLIDWVPDGPDEQGFDTYTTTTLKDQLAELKKRYVEDVEVEQAVQNIGLSPFTIVTLTRNSTEEKADMHLKTWLLCGLNHDTHEESDGCKILSAKVGEFLDQTKASVLEDVLSPQLMGLIEQSYSDIYDALPSTRNSIEWCFDRFFDFSEESRKANVQETFSLRIRGAR